MNIDDMSIGIITEIPSPKPLSYYLDAPLLEEITGSNFGKITSEYGLKELLSFTANSFWTNRGGRNEIRTYALTKLLRCVVVTQGAIQASPRSAIAKKRKWLSELV